MSQTPVAPELSSDELTQAYRVAVRNRSMDERIVRLISQGKVKFAIYGAGEEIQATATALGWFKATGGENVGIGPHYRSGTLSAMWVELQGRTGFVRDVIRQQLCRVTDPVSGGRQMVNHLEAIEQGILPGQSPLGMNLSKAAGWAKAMRIQGAEKPFAAGIIGDGSTAEIDTHDAMNAISVWNLPMVLVITDNGIAISTEPADGRGIKDFEAYARAFGLRHFVSDGTDFFGCYQTAFEVATYVRESGRGAVWHIDRMPRLNGHSSAGNYRFDLEQPDPILLFGQELVDRAVLEAADICTRIPGKGADYFAHHDLGRIMGEEDAQVGAWFKEAGAEPEPDPESIFDHIRPPLPKVVEPPDLASRPTTSVTYAGALRITMRRILESKPSAIWGQDVGKLGGVMQATAGLKGLFPDRVLDAPINEPLIVGTAVGAALAPGFTAMPEIQFGDYSLNAYHWLVHMGNLYWSSVGKVKASVILRMPSDPFGGGAIYHSMSLDGFFTPIPGLVILMPSTSYDVYGLMQSAAEYGGPVVVLEPKYCYRRCLGPAFPDEPDASDTAGIKALQDHVRRGGIPEVGEGVRVPIGKGIVRRPGTDLTLVGWGRGALFGEDAAETLAAEGIDVEVIDLRTLVPPDMELVLESVARTGRLVVAADDRPFGGFHREIQAQVVEAMPGVPTLAVGMENVPGIAQNETLEHRTALNPEKVAAACRALLNLSARQAAAGAGLGGWNWIPSRYFVG